MSNTSNKIWEFYFGDALKAEDAFGVTIYKNKYFDNNNNSEKGSWTIDHIFPENPIDDNSYFKRYGANSLHNFQPLSVKSNKEKGPRLRGKVNGITFSIKIIKQNENGVIGRMMIKDGKNWYWAYN